MRLTAIIAIPILLSGAGLAVAGDTTPGSALGAGGGSPRATADLSPVPFDSAATARYRRTALALAAAMGTGDAKAFRELHTDAGWAQADDWWKGMLENQKRSFGRVVKAEGPLRGVVRGGNLGAGIPPDGAAILVRFEKEAGATMSFVLDDDGRIVRSSLWVLRELARANPEGAEVLWPAPRRGRK